ncbi:MAG: response regulator [Deltaproteobacteria bacterium]|nr:response regulator [Deltaproteobacteria bacterium]
MTDAARAAVIDVSVLNGKRVLVIEDSQDYLLLLETYFDGVPVEYRFVTDGNAAIKMLSEERWDVVLLDNQLPGVSGIEILQWLRSNEIKMGLSKTPVVAISADVLEDSAFKEYKEELADFLMKPFKKKDLLDCLIAVVKGQRLKKLFGYTQT